MRFGLVIDEPIRARLLLLPRRSSMLYRVKGVSQRSWAHLRASDVAGVHYRKSFDLWGRTRADAARKARSAVVNRARPPPRRRTLSWWRGTAFLEIQLVEAAADERAE